MGIILGHVEDNSNYTGLKDGTFKAKVKLPDNTYIERDITYVSPYYRPNAGGMIAIPEIGSTILVFHNEEFSEDEDEFYFLGCAVSDRGNLSPDRDPDFQAIRDNDPKAKTYSNKDKPVTQSFTNMAGAGMLIQRNFDDENINNNVTLKSENGCEVNAGALGVQVKTNQGDSIILKSDTRDDNMANRSLTVETKGPQMYKCTNSDITMRIRDGGDFIIENNSTGKYVAPIPDPGRIPALAGTTKFSGNIRIKSRYRDIILGALGDSSKIHIVTNNAKLVLDSESGNVDVMSTGKITFQGDAGIDLKSTGPINIASTSAINLSSTNINNDAAVLINNRANELIINSSKDHVINSVPIKTVNPAGINEVTLPPNFQVIPPVVAPVTIPTPLAQFELPVSDFNDGLPGGGAI